VQRHDAPSRRELAQRAGITHDTLNDILLGRRWPRTDRLVRIAAAAGVTIGVV
jgi:transcriptional regulator with XRE-family HTH domain